VRGRSSGAFLSGLVGLAVGTAVLGCVGVVAAGAGIDGTVLPTGSVVSIGSTAAHLTAPADGRLRGPNFTATATGVAWPASSASSPDYVAGPGHRLVVFGFSLTSDQFVSSPGTGQLSASLVVSAHPLPIDLTPIYRSLHANGTGATLTGTGTFVASVPATDHDVQLQLTSEGFSQQLDLWTLRRTGAPTSPVLYRDPTSPTVAASGGTGAPKPITVTDTATGQSNPIQVSITAASLSPFFPGTSEPATAGQAYLALQFQSNFTSTFGTPTYCRYIAGITPLPGSDVTVTPTGGTAAPTQAEDPVGPADQQPMNNDSGLLDAVYVATVPADLTTGTVTVAAGTTTGTPYTGCEGTTSADPVQVAGPTAFTVTFPAVPTAATQSTPPWVGAPLPPTGTPGTGTSTAGRTGSGFPIWLAVLLVVLVAAGVVAVQRFRRRPPPTDERPGTPPGPGTPSSAPEAGAVPTPAAEPTRMPVTPRPEPAHSDPVTEAAQPPAGASTSGRLTVRVLGPVHVTGWLVEPGRRLVEELCCYLALHPDRPRTADQLQAALWPVESERPEATRKTLHNNMSLLRQAAGPERLPESGAAGYQLVDVGTDWHDFRQLLGEAETADGPASVELRFRALELVRGEPFADVPAGRYEWAVAELLVTDMVAAIVEAAGRLSAELLAAGDVEGAERAARLGLRASPSELALWEAVAHAVLARGDADAEARLWRDLTVLLGPADVTRLRSTVAAR